MRQTNIFLIISQFTQSGIYEMVAGKRFIASCHLQQRLALRLQAFKVAQR